jgi:hypothetical protein
MFSKEQELCSKKKLPLAAELFINVQIYMSESHSCLHFSSISRKFRIANPEPGMGTHLASILVVYLC